MIAIRLDAMRFHIGQDLDEGTFQRLIDGGHAFLVQAGLAVEPEAQGDFGILGSILGRAVERHAIKRDLFLAGAADILEAERRVMEIAFGQLVHTVIVHAGMHDKAEQHCVINRRCAHAIAGQDRHIIFEIMPDLKDGIVFEQTFERFQRLILVDLARRIGAKHVA